MSRTLSILLVLSIFLAVGVTAFAGDHKLTWTYDGDAAGDRMGHGVAGAGDVNADGHDDFIIGAYYGNNSRPGYARVYSGRTGKVLYNLKGQSSYMDGFGVSVNAAGDVNADGYADVIVGAHLDDGGGNDAGMARVFSGKDGAVLYTFEGDGTGDRFGLTANGAGDVDKDGYDDVIIGAYYTSNGAKPGYAKVMSGKTGKLIWKLTGKYNRDYYGVYVAGAGDVNADGYADVVIGASLDDTYTTDAGRAEVVSGKTGKVLYSWNGDRYGAYSGRCVDGAGDVNLDGYDDVVVGSYLDDAKGTDSGTVKVYSGKTGLVLYTWYGSAADDRLGVHVDGGGDINNDGYPDIIAGAYCDDENGSNCGSLRAYSGKDGSILYTFYGQNSLVYMGRFACILGDANGDGFDDIIGGAYGEDYGASDTGRAYVWISPAPTGSVEINYGDEATADTSVTLSLSYLPASVKDTVTDMRLRDEGDAWGAWVPVASTMPWTLPAGDGEKTVEVQYRDIVGATSPVESDSIILDSTPPTGSVNINNNYHETTRIFVTLYLSWTDLQSTVTNMRLRNEGNPWGAWQPVDDRVSWTLEDIDGTRTVEAQFRDAAGNVSDTVADSITYLSDVEEPRIDSVRVNNNCLYILPGEALSFGVYARDDLGGSGIDAFKVSYNSGSTWSEWHSFEYGPIVVVERPESTGVITATVVVRDMAWNESPARHATFYLLKEKQTWIGAGAKVSGRIGKLREVDAVELGLVKGDLLTVKIQGKSLDGSGAPELAMDLLGPDKQHLFDGQFPADLTKVMVKAFEVPETGRYTLIVRCGGDGDIQTGTWKITAKVKQAKENKKIAGTITGSEIAFDATDGSTVKVKLKGDGVDLDNVTIEGPEGPVTVAMKGKPGSVSMTATLDGGTGTYRVRFAAPLTVKAKVTVKPPKFKGVLSE